MQCIVKTVYRNEASGTPTLSSSRARRLDVDHQEHPARAQRTVDILQHACGLGLVMDRVEPRDYVVGVADIELGHILLDERRVTIGEALGLGRTFRDTLRGEVACALPQPKSAHPRRHPAVPEARLPSAG
jgi:hypothetical protein